MSECPPAVWMRQRLFNALCI